VRSIAVSSEVSSRLGDCLFLDVLGDDEAGPDFTDNPEHVGPEINSDSASSRGGAEGLAGESAADEVDRTSKAGGSNIDVAWDARPVFCEHAPAEGFDLAEGDCPHTGPLKAEAESSDAGKEVEDIHQPSLEW
jgi:hypothetical protein